MNREPVGRQIKEVGADNGGRAINTRLVQKQRICRFREGDHSERRDAVNELVREEE